ncbi:MAG: hypothetical protein RBR71_11525 [Gudongella sp.]|nr:hypothetical protein [Gudongella sp.]
MDINDFRMSSIRLSDEAIPEQMRSFDSEWNDEIHESFTEFNDFVRGSASKIEDDAKQCNDVLESVQDMDVPALVSRSESACQRAKSL